MCPLGSVRRRAPLLRVVCHHYLLQPSPRDSRPLPRFPCWHTCSYTLLLGPDELLDAEHPTLDNLEEALSFFVHFLTPLSLPLPPQAMVVQSTHHGIQALLGVVAKRLFNSAFVIWDHGILWRERLLALSGFKGASLFSRNALAGLQRICAFLTLYNADVIVPCTNIGNPGWEAWLAGGRGDSKRMALAHERISPVVNGMETDRFYVARTREEKLPSAVMLSHVCDVKDVKNAILAADYIVNKVGVKDYRLIVYGSTKVCLPPPPPYTRIPCLRHFRHRRPSSCPAARAGLHERVSDDDQQPRAQLQRHAGGPRQRREGGGTRLDLPQLVQDRGPASGAGRSRSRRLAHRVHGRRWQPRDHHGRPREVRMHGATRQA